MLRKTSGLAVALVAWATTAAAQIDPLVMVKTLDQPNVLLLVDVSSRMQRDAPSDDTNTTTSLATSSYYDPIPYPVTGQAWEAGLNITAVQSYRRRYVALTSTNANGDRFTATTIQVTGDLDPSNYSRFEAPTRLSIARAALYQAVTENLDVARFGIVKMRQTNPTIPTLGNSGPVFVADPLQQDSEVNGNAGRWKISEARVSNTDNGDSTNTGVFVVDPTAAGANDSVLNTLATGVLGAWQGPASKPVPVALPVPLLPAGNDDGSSIDAPLKLLLDDARVQAASLVSADPIACRNTVAIMIAGGGEGTTGGATNASLATVASTFLNISGRRVPIYVIAIAPPVTDVAGLRAVATTSGGRYFEITKAQIDVALTSPVQRQQSGVTAPDGTVVVPEMVKAVNLAVQHAFAASVDVDTAPSPQLPIGPTTEFQVTSPIVGTVNLDGAFDIDGQSLVPDSANVLDAQGNPIPQRSNLMVTSGFSLPGFDGSLKGFRVYKPVTDATKPSGYRFEADGAPLWAACVPGLGCAPEPDSASRNLYTHTPDGSMVAFTVANAPVLAPLMNLSVTDATAVIDEVRKLPLGAIVSSTPAVMSPPSLDPPPDEMYRGFAAANEKRRSIVWIGTNNGILEAIDARLGVEVWGFIPMNLLPKLRSLRDGQSVGSFDYFVDQSPKIADVKVADEWRTQLVVGQGAGGTFYYSFDVTMADMPAVLGNDADSAPALGQVLAYFSNASRIQLNWTFPASTSFDPTLAPYGDLLASASVVEKTVGQTWSDPAIGRVLNSAGPYTMLVGSGFLPYSIQEQPNRGGIVAGTTFYLLNIEDGSVYDSWEVAADAFSETNDDCRIDNVDACRRIKNALQTDPVATGAFNERYIPRRTSTILMETSGGSASDSTGPTNRSSPMTHCSSARVPTSRSSTRWPR